MFHSLAWLISTNIPDADMQNEKYILSFLRLCICSPYLPVALGQVHWNFEHCEDEDPVRVPGADWGAEEGAPGQLSSA